MRFLERVPEDAVITAFLRAELNSKRFGPRLVTLLDGVDPKDVFDRNPEFRRDLLARHRGWGNSEGLFAGFPEEVEWHRVAATPGEVLEIRYINWDWWLRISAAGSSPVPTRRPMSRSPQHFARPTLHPS